MKLHACEIIMLLAVALAALFALTLNLIVAGCAIAMLLLGWLSYALDYARRWQ